MYKNFSSKRFLRYRLFGYPVITVLMYLLFILINPLVGFWDAYSTYTFSNYLVELAYLLLFTCLIIESGIATTRFLDKHYPWQNRSFKRFGLQLILEMVALSGLFTLLVFFASQFTPNLITPQDELLIRQAIVLGVLVSIMITTFFTAENFLLNWNNAKMEAELLEKKALQAELATLRNQIDPHFLFNNFSTLTALIEEDSNLALEYLEKLTTVYRYLLTFRNKHTTSLHDESLFIYAYLYLFQVRYGKNLVVETNIDADLFFKKIPPLSLQLLVENAVKHNTISTKDPLRIKIYNSGTNSLIVENNLNPKITPEESTGLGISNIIKRYRLLGFPDGVTVKKTSKLFQVTIPLIEDEN